MACLSVDDAAQLLRMEYVEMPGLALNAWQAQRLCSLSCEICDAALRMLLESGISAEGDRRTLHAIKRVPLHFSD
jgi:hypothetical protein